MKCVFPVKEGPVNPVNAPAFVPTLPVSAPAFAIAPVPVKASKEESDLKSSVALKCSNTVIFAFATLMFLAASVTVKVTVLSIPIFVQSKEVTSIDGVYAQLSEEPLSMFSAVIVALPNSSNVIVKSCATAVGAILSSTATVAVPVVILPKVLVAVKVTVTSPISEQSKLEISIDKPPSSAKPTIELEPLSMSAALIVAAPFSSNSTVIFWVFTIGTGSTTVTCTGTVVLFSLASIPVNCTVIGLLFASVALKVLWLKAYVTVPQLSEPLCNTSFATILTLPFAASVTDIGLLTKVGAILSTTVTVAVAVDSFPDGSVTVKVVSVELPPFWTICNAPILVHSSEPFAFTVMVIAPVSFATAPSSRTYWLPSI